jgi:hypothetical protein
MQAYIWLLSSVSTSMSLQMGLLGEGLGAPQDGAHVSLASLEPFTNTSTRQGGGAVMGWGPDIDVLAL